MMSCGLRSLIPHSTTIQTITRDGAVGLRWLSLSLGLPASPGPDEASLGHALIPSHRLDAQLPDRLSCRVSPLVRRLTHRPGRFGVRSSLRPSVCLRPFTPAPHGAAAALGYGGLDITRVPPAGLQPAGRSRCEAHEPGRTGPPARVLEGVGNEGTGRGLVSRAGQVTRELEVARRMGSPR